MRQFDTLRRERWSRTLVERKSIGETLFTKDKRAFVILGDPGSGKSTLLHLLALVYARGSESVQRRFKAPEPEQNRLPIFVPLAAFDDMLRANPGMTLLEFLPKYFDRRRLLPGLTTLFQNALESGNALVLLDGLDEVLDSGTRRYVASQVTTMINEFTPRGVRFALTSRFVGYREAPVGQDIPHLSVLDFSTAEIKIFVHQWSHTYETWVAGGEETPESVRLAHQLEKDLLEDVDSLPSVRRLAANPLMLTMLALLRRQVGRLPHRRIELYKRYMDTMIDNWVEARSHGEREHAIDLVDPHQAESILIPLAYWLQSTQPSGTASKTDIQKALTSIILRDRGYDPNTAERVQCRDADEYSQRFLKEMRNMSGLIVERGYDAYGFLHLTFQQYFAGRALAQMDSITRWKEADAHLHDARWREPILLCAGQLGIVEKRRQEVSDFVRRILDHADPTETDLHRNLLLALSIACDDVNLEPSFVIELINNIDDCLPSNVHIFVSEIVKRLGQLILNDVPYAASAFHKILASANSESKVAVIKAMAAYTDYMEIRKAVLKYVVDQDWRTRLSAIEALASLVTTDADTRQAIFQRVEDQFSNIRLAAVKALTPLVATDAEIRQAIFQHIEDQDFDVRRATIDAIAPIIPTYLEMRQTILQHLNCHSNTQLYVLLYELAPLVANDTEIRQIFFQNLNNQDLDVREASISALAPLISQDAEVRSAILQFLENQSSPIPYSAVRVLAPLVPRDVEVCHALLKHISDQSPVVRGSVIDALAPLVSVNADIREAIFQHLEDQEWQVRRSAVEALAPLVVTDANIRQGILKQLIVVDWRLRLDAINAIAQALKDSSQSVYVEVLLSDTVQSLLAYESYSFITEGLKALSVLVANNEDIRHALFQYLNNQNRQVRRSAIEALAPLVSTDVKIYQVIFQRIKDPIADPVGPEIEALAPFVATDADVRQAIFQCLNNQDWQVRRSAAAALAPLVTTDADIRQAIFQLLEDQVFNVRGSIMILLSSLENLNFVEKANRQKLIWWLTSQANELYSSLIDEEEYTAAQKRLRDLFSSRLSFDSELRDVVLNWLQNASWSSRLAAVQLLTHWPGGTPKELIQKILDSFSDFRGLESYPARLTAASYLINRDSHSKKAIQVGMEALDYGNSPWDFFPRKSGEVRKQAALLLGTLDPVRYDQAVYDKLLDVMKTDQDSSVRDSVYTVLVKLAGMRT